MSNNLAQQIDEMTPSSRRRGEVTLSAWSWAVHRYTMGFLLMVVGSLAGAMAYDYLGVRRDVDAMKRNRDDVIIDHTQRITKLESWQTESISAGRNTLRIVQEMQLDMRELKARLPKQ